MSEEQNTEINFSINGQYIHRDGRVVGLFVSEQDSTDFVALVTNMQNNTQMLASLGDALATAAGDIPEANAWRSIRGEGE